MQKIEVRKSENGQFWVRSMRGIPSRLKVVQDSELITRKQKVETNIASMHKIMQRDTVIEWPDGTTSTVGEIVDKVDEKKAIAAEKKYT